MGNENKWDRRYHEQRAKLLQPVLDALCNQPNAWQLPILRRFLDLDASAPDIVSDSFAEAVEQVKRKLGITAELVSNDKIEILERLLFYRVETKWKEIKSNCPGKPIKALAARSLHDILIKQARMWDEMATQFTLVQDKFLAAQQSSLSSLFDSIEATLTSVPVEVKTQADLLIPKKALESILSSLSGSLSTEIQALWDLVEDGLLRASVMLDAALDSPGTETISLLDKVQQVVATLRDTIATPLCGPRGVLMQVLQKLNTEFPPNHDMAPLARLLESHKRLPDILPVCLDAILAPARPVIDVLGEILVIRISLASVDVKQGAISRVDQVLSHLESTIHERVTDLSERLHADGQEILSKLRRRKTSASNFLGPLGSFLRNLAKIWPRFLKKVTFKFSDYVWVLVRKYIPADSEKQATPDRWRALVGDSFAVAALKGFRYLMKSVKQTVDSMLRSYIMSCLDSTQDALATMSKNPTYVGSISVSIPASLTDVLDSATAVQLVLEQRLNTLIDESIDIKMLEPLNLAWTSVHPRGAFAEMLLSRAQALRATDVELWSFQQNTFRGAAPVTNAPPTAAMYPSLRKSPSAGPELYFDRMMTMRNSKMSDDASTPPSFSLPASVVRAQSPPLSSSAPNYGRPSVPILSRAPVAVPATSTANGRPQSPPMRSPAPTYGVPATTSPRAPFQSAGGSKSPPPTRAGARDTLDEILDASRPEPPKFARDLIEERKRLAETKKIEVTSYGDLELPRSVNPNYLRPSQDPFSRKRAPTDESIDSPRFTTEKDVVNDPYESAVFRQVEDAFDPTPMTGDRISAVRLTMINLDENATQEDEPGDVFILEGGASLEDGDTEDGDYDYDSPFEEPKTPPTPRKVPPASPQKLAQRAPPTLVVPYVEPTLDKSYPLIARRPSTINPAYKNVFQFNTSDYLNEEPPAPTTAAARAAAAAAAAPTSYIQLVPAMQVAPLAAVQKKPPIFVAGPKKFYLPPPTAAVKNPNGAAPKKIAAPPPATGPPKQAAPGPPAVPKPAQTAPANPKSPVVSPRPLASSSPAKASAQLIAQSIVKGPPQARSGALTLSGPPAGAVKKISPPTNPIPPGFSSSPPKAAPGAVKSPSMSKRPPPTPQPPPSAPKRM